MNRSDALINYIYQFTQNMPGMKRIIAVSRCAAFQQLGKLKGLAHRDYIKGEVTIGSEKMCVDPILRMHTSHGAKILQEVRNYRPKDEDNEGCGVLLQYTFDKDNKKKAVHLVNKVEPTKLDTGNDLLETVCKILAEVPFSSCILFFSLSFFLCFVVMLTVRCPFSLSLSL